MQPVQLLSCKDVRPNIVTMLAMGISTWPAVEPCFPSYSRKPGEKSLFERVEFGVAPSTRCKLWPALAVDGSTVVFWRLGPGLNQLQTRRASKTIHPSDITSTTTTTTVSSHNIHLAFSRALSRALLRCIRFSWTMR